MKKKLNELDPATLTLSRLLGHANPSTGKMNRASFADLVALFSDQTPVKTYANQAALLANDDLVIGYLALVSDTGTLYLYNGPTASDIANYTIVSASNYRGDYAGTTTMPTTGGTFTGGVPAAGNRWRLTNTLVIGGNVYAPGTIIEAAINAPDQTLTNWIFYAVQL